MSESKIVSAVGVSVNTLHGEEINKRLEKAVADSILACNAEGISTNEENSEIIKERMRIAYEEEMGKILEEQNRMRFDNA